MIVHATRMPPGGLGAARDAFLAPYDIASHIRPLSARIDETNVGGAA